MIVYSIKQWKELSFTKELYCQTPLHEINLKCKLIKQLQYLILKIARSIFTYIYDIKNCKIYFCIHL